MNTVVPGAVAPASPPAAVKRGRGRPRKADALPGTTVAVPPPPARDTPTTFATGDRIMSAKEVARTLTISMATLYRWRAAGHFPSPRKLGPARVGWLASDVDAWLATTSVAGRSART